MASSSGSQAVGGSSALKWQLAIALGVPVAVGIGYLYMKNYNAPSSEDHSKGRGTTKGGKKIAGSRDSSIDVETLSVAPEKKTKLQQAMKLKDEGNALFKSGQYEEAMKCYDKAITVCPTDEVLSLATFYQNKAAAHEQLKKYEEVKEDCSKALQLNPRYTKALLRRSKACEHTKDLTQALEDITAACILENFQSEVSLISADRILKELGRIHAKEAIANRKPVVPSYHFIKTYFTSFTQDPFTSFLEKDDLPESSRGFLRAVEAFKTEDYSTIIQACTEEINLTEAEALFKNEALVLRATFYQLTGEHSAAINDLDNVINNDDANSKLRVNALIKRASICMQLEDPVHCMNDFNRAVQIDPDNSDIYHHRGQVNLLMEKLKEAVDDFTLAVTLNSKYPITAVQKCYTEYRCALTARDVNKLHAVMETFEALISQFPKCAECYTLFAQVLSDQQEYERADALYEKAIKVDPQNATLFVHRALLKLQWTGEIETAVRLITEALHLDDKCEFGYETLGTIEVQRGNLQKAIEMFDKAIPLAKTELEMSHLYSLKDAAVAQQKVIEKMNIKIPKEIFNS